MRYSRIFIVILFIAGLYSYTNIQNRNDDIQVYISNFENVLGTSFELRVKAESEQVADQAETLALSEIDRLSKILSGYDANSEFSQWLNTHGIPVPVSHELYDVLSLFDEWRTRTDGALDASAQAVSLVWKKAVVTQKLPTAAELEAIVQHTQKLHWSLDEDNQTATHLSTVPLMTNTFVKSYIIKAVAGKLQTLPGVQALLINIGGDIFVQGDLTAEVRIADPLNDAENDLPVTTISIRNKAVATSGNYRRGFLINGQWYSHIVDPRSGKPGGHVISATVVSQNAVDAGALATAFNVLAPAESIRLAKGMTGIEYLVITKDGELIESDGWKNLGLLQIMGSHNNVSKNHVGKTVLQTSEQSSAELTINFELSKFEGRFRRPFVAVWIENSQKETVRNMALWFNKPKWLPDLKIWYHKNYAFYNAMETGLTSISSATRPPGAYSLSWDLKDDKGNTVPPGKYTVYIEAAREHGTYQLIRQEVDCRNKSQQIQLKGNAEIASASLEFKKNK